MLKQLARVNIICLMAITLNWTLLVFAGRKGLIQPLPDKNKAAERPLHADEITPNLPGLTAHGRAVEKELEESVREGLHPTQVGSARVMEMWHRKGSAEHQRNARHLNNLHFKKEIRKKSQTVAGRIRLKLGGVKELAEENKIEKNQFRQTLRDIAHDTKVHRKLNTIGEKDANFIEKPKFKMSKILGYDSDGASKGSSYGYRSRSPSPSSSVEIISRPRRHTPPPKSSPSSSAIPSLSLSRVSGHSSSSSSTSGSSSSKKSPSSTATSKLRS
ncbi:uncharacterized protein FA14DRAFT_159880, partial [Meira miltonrushii]